MCIHTHWHTDTHAHTLHTYAHTVLFKMPPNWRVDRGPCSLPCSLKGWPGAVECKAARLGVHACQLAGSGLLRPPPAVPGADGGPGACPRLSDVTAGAVTTHGGPLWNRRGHRWVRRSDCDNGWFPGLSSADKGVTFRENDFEKEAQRTQGQQAPLLLSDPRPAEGAGPPGPGRPVERQEGQCSLPHRARLHTGPVTLPGQCTAWPTPCPGPPTSTKASSRPGSLRDRGS